MTTAELPTAQQLFEKHAQPTEPYWEIGTMHNAFLAKACGDMAQVYLLGDGRIVDSFGRTFAALLRPHLVAKRHIPSQTPQEKPHDSIGPDERRDNPIGLRPGVASPESPGISNEG